MTVVLALLVVWEIMRIVYSFQGSAKDVGQPVTFRQYLEAVLAFTDHASLVSQDIFFDFVSHEFLIKKLHEQKSLKYWGCREKLIWKGKFIIGLTLAV